MVNCYNEDGTRQLKRKMFDISSSEFGSSKKHFRKIKNAGKLGNQEVDSDYKWFLDNMPEAQTEVIRSENQIENDIVKEYEDENDKDPRYCMFLEKLTKDGKSYMLEVSQNGATHFLKYEEDEESDGFSDRQTCIENHGVKVTSFEDMDDIQINQRANRRLHGETSTMREVSRRKNSNKHESMNVSHQDNTPDSCYQLLLDGIISSDYGAFKYEGKLVKYEDKVTISDSDIKILDDDQDFNEVNNKVSSLKEKLICILQKPYNQKEYKELTEFVNKEMEICRILDLRGRPVSSALGGVTKSLLDYSPGSFRRKLLAAKNEPCKALNLLRMFRFWLQHLPHEDLFEPWLDKKILEVLPNKAGKDVRNPLCL